MELRVVCLLSVWACAVLTSCVLAGPSQTGSSEDLEGVDETMLLKSLIDWAPANLVLGDVSADVTGDDTFARRRRQLAGVHFNYPSSRSRFRRPRLFVPRRRPGNRGSSRNNVSPY